MTQIALFLAGLLVPLAFGQEPPLVPCGNLPGCGGAENLLTDAALPGIAQIMLRVAAGLAVIFIIVAGYQMMFAAGDEGKYQTGKTAIVYVLLGIGVAVMSQLLVSFILTEQSVLGVTEEVGALGGVVTILLGIFNAIFLLLMAFCGIKMLLAQGKTEEFGRAKAMITQCIIGAVVVNLAHALVYAVASFFGV